MKRCALFAYVTTTELAYNNSATRGVGRVANKLITELEPVFKKESIFDLGSSPTREMILTKLREIPSKLDDDGLCLFYFHGHGDCVPGAGLNDEAKDQALVCRDNYLLDDDLDEALRLFKENHRILTIIDSCSSETVIEWTKIATHAYPQIIHIAAAKDDDTALASIRGGLFSTKIFNLIYGGAHEGYTYKAFTTRLRLNSITTKCYVNFSPNTTNKFLNTKLFE